MATVANALEALAALAPLELAEEWDNVGLLVGDAPAPLGSVLTCLTLTPDVVEEAISAGVGLVVTHHPLPFRGVKSISTATIDGGSLWRLARAGVAVYSPHTAYDSAVGGINQQWADALELSATRPLSPVVGRGDGAGGGRIGEWEGGDFAALVEAVRRVANPASLRVVPPRDGRCERVAIACGSGGSLLDRALEAGCRVFLTGELGFHECLRCRSLGVGVVLTGHYASERGGIVRLAAMLAERLPEVTVRASRVESDPLGPAS